MRTTKKKILAELRWQLGDARWKLSRFTKARSDQFGRQLDASSRRLAKLRSNDRSISSRFGLTTLFRRFSQLPWKLLESPRTVILGSLTGFSLLGVAAATAVVAPPAEIVNPQQRVVEQLAVSPEEIAEPELPFVYEDRIAAGDTVQTLFHRLHINDPQTLETLRANTTVTEAIREARVGDTVLMVVDASGKLLSMRLPLGTLGTLDVSRPDASVALKISTPRKIAVETGTQIASGVIRSTLFSAASEAGVPDNIVSQLTDIFDGQIDFKNELARGDTFNIVFETSFSPGTPVRAGRILAAEFINRGKRHVAFRYASTDGRAAYYAADGQAMRQGFLKSPLEYSRITSTFGSREHPLKHYWHLHTGVDLGAPTGTPVRVTSDGVVSFAGRQSGYGNVVIVKHRNSISTYYAHLSSIAPGLQAGDIISKGEVVGGVGSTGSATGPHLHYEIRIENVPHDPMTVTLPAGTPLAASELNRFRKNTAPLQAQLTMLNRRLASNTAVTRTKF